MQTTSLLTRARNNRLAALTRRASAPKPRQIDNIFRDLA